MQENGWVHSQKQISSSEDTVDTVELEAYCESDNEHWLDYSIRPPQMILPLTRTRIWTRTYSLANKISASRKMITWIRIFVSSVPCLQAAANAERLLRFHH
ncbi:uncharacterized protein [Physcomitrium patens]|uniref:uncharacterized protein n=1 Tax=Physcomitrium patens TaxID=3218 RepID=UPI003CCE43D0